MRTIKLRDDLTHKTRDVLKEMLSKPQQGVNVGQMERRLTILKVLDTPITSLTVEDEDHATILATYKSNMWAVVHDDLVTIKNDIESAEIIVVQQVAAPAGDA
jgi:hypothetical protein